MVRGRLVAGDEADVLQAGVVIDERELPQGDAVGVLVRVVLRDLKRGDVKDAARLVIDPALLNAGDVELEQLAGRGSLPATEGADVRAACPTAQTALAQVATDCAERDADLVPFEARLLDREVGVELVLDDEARHAVEPVVREQVGAALTLVRARRPRRPQLARDFVDAGDGAAVRGGQLLRDRARARALHPLHGRADFL